jgi:hypothetical protein
MKYPNLVYTILLSVLLFVPFAVRFGFTEPYPAVLLPSGAGTIKVGDHINRTAIYGRKIGSDAWTNLSPSQFLHPIPIEFFPNLAERSFGLSPSPYRVFKLGPIKIDTQRKLSQEDVESAKQWLGARLAQDGYEANALRITQEVLTLRQSQDAPVAVRCQDEKVLDLR